MSAHDRPGWLWASLVFNLLLAALCLLLIHQNRELKSRRDTGSAGLKSGDRVEGFEYRTLQGGTGRVSYPGSRRLLFVISTTCPFCQKSLPNIQGIFDRHRDRDEGILAVSIHDLDLTKTFASQWKVGFRLVSAADDEFGRAYRISGVPTTLLIDGDGRVTKVWEGEITARTARDIEASLNEPQING